MQTPRGQIHTRDRARQLRDFSGLLFGNITPTDIDGLIEYKNIGYIFIETKLESAPFPCGQRLALKRLTDDLKRTGKKSICLVVEHDNYDVKDDIDVVNSIVTEYRYNSKWQVPKNKNITAKEFIKQFIILMEVTPHAIKR